eukprot:symbB.v1.2.036984.t1/scaffold5348.1/size28215/2
MALVEAVAVGRVTLRNAFLLLPSLALFLLPCEILGLQFLVENRLQSLWPALNRPGCKLWLGRCLRMEVASLFLFVSSAWLNLTHTTEMFDPATGEESIWGIVVYLTLLLTICAVPILFLIWIVLVAMTLFRVVLMFHKALKVARQQGLAVVATFQVCCGRSILQCTGVVISLATSLMMLVAAFLFAPDYAVHGSHSALYGTIVPQCINLLINAAGIILLCRGLKSLCRSSLEICEENDWEKKTRELANRGISLEELLAFYKKLGDTVMESFQPSVHTTTDVVRLAIIPMTASSCSSYAQLVNKGEKVLPKKMVTHNWSNLFRDLVASVISETLGEQTFEFIAELLSDKAGICGANPAGTVDPVTGLTHPTCKCNEPKFFNTDPPLNDDGKSIHCEMNKFDDMMALLARENPDFAEVVAVDASLDLFGRAWCVAELAEAHRMGMAQSLKMRNEETLLRRQLTLQGLKVENMKASRPEDVVEILAKIPDKEAFNAKLQELIFDSNVGLLAAWKDADALQQMEEVSHLLKWLRLSEAVEGGQIVWQRWLP